MNGASSKHMLRGGGAVLSPGWTMSALAARFALCLCLVTAPGLAKDDDEADYVEVASVLVQDGNFDRAEETLRQVDESDEDLDRAKYHTLYGLIYLNRNEMPAARDAFEKAVATGEVQPTIHIYLAQVYFGLEEYENAVKALDAAGAAAARLPSVYTMRAHAHWMLGNRGMTWAVLDDARERFPANHTFLQRKVYYLIELGLFQEAAELGREYLAVSDAKVKDYVALGNSLRKSGQLDEAVALLESTRLRFPGDDMVTRVLAHTYVDLGQMHTAADLLNEAAMLNPELRSEAAELFRRAGNLHRALSLNAGVSDSATKLKQRLAILVGLARYDAVTAMEPSLRRAGLFNDEDIRYALAYAWFKSGDYERTESHLTALRRNDLFRKATELRKIMEDCAGEEWRCA